MSFLDKMSIMGIRSFSPLDEQVITFSRSSPITLILGPNGTGKTTIIECLRYATTGTVPPGSDIGKSFIHDPKIAGEREVKGRVKLKFKDVNNKPIIVTRMAEVSQKVKNLKFQTLGGSIVRLNDQGEKITISSKCTEIDREVISLMGVSKPILNNVIFCHQEDSNWPLSDSKVLKDKFDEIFAATRYVKVLDIINKQRLQYEQDCKQFTSDKIYLEQNKTQANKFRKEIEMNEARLAVNEDEIKLLKEKMEPIQKELDQILKREINIMAVSQKLAKKETELELEKTNLRDLEEKIEIMHKGSIEELETEIANFKKLTQNRVLELDNCQAKESKLKKEIESETKRLKDLILELGKLRTNAKTIETQTEKRNISVRSCFPKYDIPVPKDINKLDRRQLKKQFDDVLETMTINSENRKKELAKEEEDVQSKLDERNDSISRLSETVDIKNKQIVKNKEELETIGKQLKEIESSVLKLDGIRKTIKEKESELERITGQLNVDVVKQEIESAELEVQSYNEQISDLDSEMFKLNKQANVIAELEMLRKDKKSKEDNIKKLKSKHDDSLRHLLGNIPTTNIRDTITRLIRDLKTKVNEYQNRQKTLDINLATLNNKRETTKNDLNDKEKNLREYEDQMFRSCGNKDLDISISQLETSIKSSHDEKGSFIGTQYLYTTFVEKLKRAEPCCPLCHRDFGEPQDVEELITELNNKLSILPSELKSKQNNIEDMQRKLSNLSDLKPVRAQMEKLKIEIPALKSSLKKFEIEIEACRTELSEIEDNLLSTNTDIAVAEAMNPDLALWEQHAKDLVKTDKSIKDVEVKLEFVSERTVNELNEEKQLIQNSLSEKQAEIKQKRQMLGDYEKRKIAIQTEINKLGGIENKIAKDAQMITQLQSKSSQLQSEDVCYEKEIQQHNEEKKQHEIKINQYNQMKKSVRNEITIFTNTENEKFNEASKSFNEITLLHNSIITYIENKEPERLKSFESKHETVQRDINEKETEKEKIVLSCQTITREIDNNKGVLRNLEDCLTYKKKEENLISLTVVATNLKEKLGGYDMESLTLSKQKLESKISDLSSQISREKGKCEGLHEEITRQKDNLQAEQYINADQLYTKKLIDLKVAKAVSSDLLKYYTALDNSIMQYHGIKMAEINKIIKDLWTKTYKGNDIDYLEIRAEGNETKGTSCRRQYNYRVVMVKSGIEQVMRGRCSAGQKVLASLVIRLALAETFCLNCGIMALDEPTTNLDRDNINSLCDALAEIAAMRAADKFQLIVISHDEDFVNKLGRAAGIDDYFLMIKNDSAHSTICTGSIKTSALYN